MNKMIDREVKTKTYRVVGAENTDREGAKQCFYIDTIDINPNRQFPGGPNLFTTFVFCGEEGDCRSEIHMPFIETEDLREIAECLVGMANKIDQYNKEASEVSTVKHIEVAADFVL